MLVDLESLAVEGDESEDKAATKAEQEDDVTPGVEGGGKPYRKEDENAESGAP